MTLLPQSYVPWLHWSMVVKEPLLHHLVWYSNMLYGTVMYSNALRCTDLYHERGRRADAQ